MAQPVNAGGAAANGLEELLDKYRRGMSIIVEGARIDTGQTPKEVVWTKNKARLYRYEPYREKKYRTPILIVYALINRPYVLDLIPGNSFIEYLVGEGFDVYMLDWGIPGDEDAEMSFEHYVLDYLPRAARKVMRTSGTEDYTLFGYCMGGTMSAMYAALFPERMRNLVLLTAPIAFPKEHLGLYALFTDSKYLDPGIMADAFGCIPGEIIDTGNRMLRPVTNYVGTYVSMWERIFEDKPMETWLAMNKWVNDGPPFPGAAFKQWITEFYQQNRLVKGEIRLRGRRVDLSNIRCPLLSVAGKKDHICTVPQAEAIMDLVSSEDKEFFVLDAGHVGLMTGRGAKKGLWPKVSGWLSERSG
ncbi:Poly(R)-hydroxyalkanoic acid synthase, class III, PhaC subunit [Rubrobacter xylanophilus DSM 9941]|mgnify:CR=1 FL=1|uniref:Poly(3-hydroxyalkanoate) polymerase subunit PhaC n=1 Tax=Rubrobacter xylanophilus (strain DSM 9941 / JCM 11954 / NBRC 16129 / PRD-1) TaxID=266117 RepID=Q1ATG5_RUBXD|nr:class III poly(R)-hydroxyalkanoic acid synthase subunit PhaC [Rubrobacter xylanophilus]ABG05313.1 Poly(R)-hydroxyalkanoic acid synthase, class III, PhaC subunit [Rubrobacter xylanophilus DSM 9941]